MPRPDKRQAVMDATLEIIAEQGFHNAPTSQIAERAKVGMGTIYRYFKSKDELIEAIFQDLIEAIRLDMVAGYDPALPLRERYIGLCGRIFDYLVGHPVDFRFYEQFKTSPYVAKSDLTLARQFEQGDDFEGYPFFAICKEGLATGAVKPMPIQMLAALTFSPISDLVSQVLADTFRTEADTRALLFAACWDAVAAS